MVHKKSKQSPTKSTPTHQAATHPALWMDADVNILLDLAITHKPLAGEGMNFKAPFWNAVSDALSNPSKGGPKTSKLCKKKWKRISTSFPPSESSQPCHSAFQIW
ncbi:hypothetical protein BKA83DRAFT_4493355 [Pisolithus microcarpus]|nr:hypothetical protein BKA83DRAFT_4500603 [Pisolithus microcarpus]KAI6023211.1 hypothetical protein BKA83DRAFT_4493355 [Pisolithus microcarpus]